MINFRVLAAALLAALLLCGGAAAAPDSPLTIAYQGHLADLKGQPVHGTRHVVFTLYTDASGGEQLWSETHEGVSVAKGVFSVMLGTIQSLEVLTFDNARWLGIRVVGEELEMAPRQRLGSAPFAFIAQRAESLSGTATIQGSQIAGPIAGSQVTGALSGSTLAQLQTHFIGALQPTSIVANTLSTVDPALGVGQYSSIAIGADSLPVVAYFVAGSFDLKVAKCANAACTAGTSTLSTVDLPGSLGLHSSIAVGADGLPVIAYYNGANDDLRVAKCANAACSGGASVLSTVDSAGSVGQYASVAIGADGLPVIAYYDATNFDLKVAKCANAACSGGTSTLNTVDSGGNVGQFSSIAIGADGLPVISYYDATNFNLKVAKCTNATCAAGTSTITAVDSTDNVGQSTSLAIGADGLAVISYYDATNFNLKVAKCTNAACTASTRGTVDVGPLVGGHNSITIGADGLPVVAYVDSLNANLKVAKCANAACTAGTSALGTVDSVGNVGQYPSIAIGADGLPVISYYDGTNFNLKLAKCANTLCSSYFWRR